MPRKGFYLLAAEELTLILELAVLGAPLVHQLYIAAVCKAFAAIVRPRLLTTTAKVTPMVAGAPYNDTLEILAKAPDLTNHFEELIISGKATAPTLDMEFGRDVCPFDILEVCRAFPRITALTLTRMSFNPMFHRFAFIPLYPPAAQLSKVTFTIEDPTAMMELVCSMIPALPNVSDYTIVTSDTLPYAFCNMLVDTIRFTAIPATTLRLGFLSLDKTPLIHALLRAAAAHVIDLTIDMFPIYDEDYAHHPLATVDLRVATHLRKLTLRVFFPPATRDVDVEAATLPVVELLHTSPPSLQDVTVDVFCRPRQNDTLSAMLTHIPLPETIAALRTDAQGVKTLTLRLHNATASTFSAADTWAEARKRCPSWFPQTNIAVELA